MPVQRKKTAKNSSPAPKFKQPKMSSPTIEPKKPEYKAAPKTVKYIVPTQDYVAPQTRPQTVPQVYYQQPAYIPQEPVYRVPQ